DRYPHNRGRSGSASRTVPTARRSELLPRQQGKSVGAACFPLQVEPPIAAYRCLDQQLYARGLGGFLPVETLSVAGPAGAHNLPTCNERETHLRVERTRASV